MHISSNMRWDLPVGELKEGDVIVAHDCEITIETIRPYPLDAEHYAGGVRVFGRITKGYGRGKRIHSWSYVAEQTVDARVS